MIWSVFNERNWRFEVWMKMMDERIESTFLIFKTIFVTKLPNKGYGKVYDKYAIISNNNVLIECQTIPKLKFMGFQKN